MTASFPVLALTVSLALALLLALLNLQFWLLRPEDRSPLWLSAWLAAGAMYAYFRLEQFADWSDAVYALLPRITLTCVFVATWCGFELVSAIIGAAASRRMRWLFTLLILLPIVLTWTTQLVLTSRIQLEGAGLGASFHGAVPGPLFPAAGALLIALGAVQPIRLVWAQGGSRKENLRMAGWFAVGTLLGVIDIASAALGRGWIRFYDFSFLPIGFFFTSVELERGGRLYRILADEVRERTTQLAQTNVQLEAEVQVRQEAEEAARRRAETLTRVQAAVRELVTQRDPAVLYQSIVEHAAGLLGTSGGALYLCDHEQRQVRCMAARGTKRDYVNSIVKYGEGVVGRVAETGEQLAVEDYRHWEGWLVRPVGEAPARSQLAAPLRWKQELLGVLQVLEPETLRRFTAEDNQLLALFASQAATVLESSLLLEAAQAGREQASALADVAWQISESLELPEVLERIALHARELLRADTSAVYLVEPGSSTLHAAAALGPDAKEIKAEPLEVGLGILGGIAARGSGEVVNEVLLDPRAITVPGTEEDPFEHLMGVPVHRSGVLRGLIAVWRSGSGREFNAEDLAYLGRLGSQVAVAIENARLYETTNRRLVEINAVHTVSTALRTARTLREALPIILDQLTSLLDARSAALEVVAPDTDEIVTLGANGDWASVTGMRAPSGSGVSGHVMETGKPYFNADIVSSGIPVWPQKFGQSRAVACVPIVSQGKPGGVLWIGRESPVLDAEISLLASIGEMVGTAVERLRLHDQTQALLQDLFRSRDELVVAYDETIAGWSRALDLRDHETEGHTARLTGMTLRMARAAGLAEEEMVHIRRGALLHDIGKMGISDRLLLKTGPLTPEEWDEMRKHPVYALELLRPIAYLRPALDIPYCHHEKWDGTGYPRGLKGEEIPLVARLFAVVDVFDALTHDRRYRAAWTRGKALDHIREGSGSHFDPKAVELFMGMLMTGRLAPDAT
jgi:GAF domain-containing protein